MTGMRRVRTFASLFAAAVLSSCASVASWREAYALEAKGDLAGAARAYEAVARSAEGKAARTAAEAWYRATSAGRSPVFRA